MSVPGGSRNVCKYAAPATAANGSSASPARKRPPLSVTALASVWSMCAAMAIIRPRSSVTALMTAPPPMTAERLPQLPMPYGRTAVSPSLTAIQSIGIVRISDATWARVVSCPWPCDLVPAATLTWPSGCTATIAISKPPNRPAKPCRFGAVASTIEAMPIPTNRPSARAVAWRARGAVVVELGKEEVELVVEAAGIVEEPGGRDEGSRAVGNVVAPANLGRVDADVFRDEIHDAFDREEGLGLAEPAVRADWALVRSRRNGARYA